MATKLMFFIKKQICRLAEECAFRVIERLFKCFYNFKENNNSVSKLTSGLD